jgi:hypothetical protein
MSWNLLGGTEKTTEDLRIADVTDDIQPKHFLNAICYGMVLLVIMPCK